MTFSSFLSYFIILFIATISPGPSMLLAMNHGLNHGLAKTLYSCLGNLAGNILMALISILGLGAVLLASGAVFNCIKLIGIAYLIVIGLQLIVKPAKADESHAIPGKAGRIKNKGNLFIDGFIIAIGNPKGILFFTALFPQFINAKSNSIVDSVVIISTLAIVAFVCFMAYATFGQRLKKIFRLQAFRKIFNKIAGSLFIATGLAMAHSKR